MPTGFPVSISGEKPIPWRRARPIQLFLVVGVVSISGEKPIPWRLVQAYRCVLEQECFNLRREANPLATLTGCSVLYWNCCFNLRREANPLATYPFFTHSISGIRVSISGEKPIPWRRDDSSRLQPRFICFNLRREANPLATPQRGRAVDQDIIVSISGEKPIPWRPWIKRFAASLAQSFNLRREANPLATQNGAA